ncbi:GAF domain-containing protein [Pseudarthrobacter sp. DSP2-3-2b1]|uniref:GAF domain-containing protein n=1 Tax=Pseudarthrobacter sp. DSP2-3-2b1 TaxID=2804661 RepID=UPI003CF5F994
MPQPLPLNELTFTVARIKGLLLTQEKAHGAVGQLTSGIRDVLPPGSGAGVSLLDERVLDGQGGTDDGGWTSVGTTGYAVLNADTVQFELRQGPCLTAWSTQRTVLVRDAGTDDRWPLWSRIVSGLSIRSVVSSPLVVGTRCLGTLKIYSPQPAAFDDSVARTLEKFAAAASTLLDNIQGSEAPHRLTEALGDALRSRDDAARAQGILMQQYGLSPDRALEELLLLSRASGKPLVSVIAEIVTGAGEASLRDPDPA